MIDWPLIPAAGWSSPYIGVDYLDQGRDMGGFDCWGLNVHIYDQHFGVIVPDHGPAFSAVLDGIDKATTPERYERAFVRQAQRLIRQQRKSWTEIKAPLEGATVLLRRAGQPVHTGICLSGGDVLHADYEIGHVIRERISDLSDIVEAYYVPPGIAVDPRLCVT